jgi:hypothetical protein
MEEEVKPPLSVAMHSHESTTGAETASLRGSLQTLQTQTAEHITRLDAIPNTITMDLTVRLRVSAQARHVHHVMRCSHGSAVGRCSSPAAACISV